MIVYKTLVIFIIVVSQCSQYLAVLKKSMEGFITGGLTVADIKTFPHALYILFACPNTANWLCSGSILTQNVFLTAGHCLTDCEMRIQVAAGSEDIYKPKLILRDIDAWQQHEYFDDELYRNDIALLATKKELPFGRNLKRIMLMRKIPEGITEAIVAGWGLVSHNNIKKPTSKLKYVVQFIKTKEECERTFGEYLGQGELCAWNSVTHHPDMHDSGSALITRYGLQLGFVTYTFPENPQYIVYTNVSHYYHWIHDQSKKLYCVVKRMSNRDKHEDEYYDEDPNDDS